MYQYCQLLSYLVVSPSWVCFDLMSLALMLAPTIWELRRSPTLNIRQSLSSLREMTACLENTSVSARLLGCEIFTNIQPTWTARKEGGFEGQRRGKTGYLRLKDKQSTCQRFKHSRRLLKNKLLLMVFTITNTEFMAARINCDCCIQTKPFFCRASFRSLKSLETDLTL